jgi:hypothetical protein
MIVLLLVRLGATSIVLPRFLDQMLADHELLFRLVSGPLMMVAFVWALISTPSIRRLTSRQHE